MFQQPLEPIAGSLTLSALVAALPLITIFVLLGWARLKAHWAGLAALAVAIIVAVLGYGMPAKLAVLSASQGATFGLLPIMAIVLAALWVYQLTVVSGRFEDLRAAFHLISDDPRIQAIVIAFCFGGLLEALAGFGAPVAITGVMLMAMGFSAHRAAAVVLVANTAPVAFGAIATPILTAGALTGIAPHLIGSYVGRQTPVLACVVPLLLLVLVDGVRGIREIWPAAVVTGAAFAISQFVSSNYISVELTDIVASLAGLLALVVFLQVWRPAATTTTAARERLAKRAQQDHGDSELVDVRGTAATGAATGTTTISPAVAAPSAAPLAASRVFMALLPYLVIIVVFTVAKLSAPVSNWLLSTDVKVHWPGLDGQVLSRAGKPLTSTVYTFAWLSSPATMLLFAGLLVIVLYQVSPAVAVREFAKMLHKLRFAFLTVASVLALAYVMNQSGQTITIGNWIAGAGAAFAFLSPILGWLGTAVTGSDTSANALFATLQQATAAKAGIDPALVVAANTSGGVVGKMISPQNLTIAATAVGLLGRESDLFRLAIKWSVALLIVMCLLVGLQSTPILSWMLP
ncbi:MAG: L-lactate permease [Verrucomicrobia bacterium]|nr:L-lactate permease [Verrucomicrobiota bacterium]